MFPGCISLTTGRLRVKSAVPVNPAHNHGIACGADFVYGFNAAPVGYVNGLSVSDADGSLAISPTAAITHFQNGIPYAIDVVATENAVPARFLNGLPLTAAGKVAIEVVV
jgi:hypothetical protein